MTILGKILYWYSFFLLMLILVSGLALGSANRNTGTLTIVGLMLSYFGLKRLKVKILPNIISFVGAMVGIVLLAMNAGRAQSPYQLTLGLIFGPVALFFWLEMAEWIGEGWKKINLKKFKNLEFKNLETRKGEEGEVIRSNVTDEDRRRFLKIVGGTSLGIVALSLINPKKAGAAFFGSVPGPGTVALKDSGGVKIDPAIKQPTDGYKISQVDDSTAPAYYGYVNNGGAWYIMKEEADGSYRYVRGASGFSTGWTNRASQTYDYFDAVF
ncbi:hypothetical protein KBC75_00490 [Candidatus Shapirobacteria bacterium]|nr:hypothetical protein [Candidatus Shapirobacteria bacterium]